MLERERFPRLCQLASIICVIALVYLSLAPIQLITRTQVLSGREEHWLAYLLTALFSTLATGTRGAWVAAGGLVGLAALLEIGQSLSIGRHPAIADFSASALGALMGTAVGALTLVGLRARAAVSGYRTAKS